MEIKNMQESEIFDISQAKLLNPVTLKRLEDASRLLGEVNQVASNVFEFDFIIEALKNIESLTSARIEGTTGNLEDLYLKDSLNFEQKQSLKLFSAINYKTTINELEEIINSHKKLDVQLMRYLHKLLTEKDPATSGVPGKFREKDVRIRNTKLGDFYPPEHFKIPELMDRFVKEASKDQNPNLIHAALVHCWFESIHPFEDGNGRTGRLLITAILLQRKIIKTPVLNLSQFFDAHRDDYIYALRQVTDEKDYTPWVDFFLKGVIRQCEHNIELIQKLRKLKEENSQMIRASIKGSQVAQHILELVLNTMFITAPQARSYLDKIKLPLKDSYQAALNNLRRLEKLGILEKIEGNEREIKFVHAELKKLIMGG
jgi:Fic family protein